MNDNELRFPHWEFPRYYAFCPRGFVNETTYIRADNVAEALELQAELDGYSDTFPEGWTGWSTNKEAPHKAISFRDWRAAVPVEGPRR